MATQTLPSITLKGPSWDVININQIDIVHYLQNRPDIFKNLNNVEFNNVNQIDQQLIDKISYVNKLFVVFKIPKNLDYLTNIVQLSLDKCLITDLPHTITSLTNLRCLTISSCDNLTTLPQNSNWNNLHCLTISSCDNLTTLPQNPNWNNLQKLSIQKCKTLTYLPDNFGYFPSLPTITIPDTITCSSNLQILEITFCDNLTSFPNTLTMNKLKQLSIENCERLTHLPNEFGPFPNLTIFQISHCPHVILPTSLNMPNLLVLYIRESNCTFLPMDFNTLLQLSEFSAIDCPNLIALPESFGTLRNLEKFNIDHCQQFNTLPIFHEDIHLNVFCITRTAITNINSVLVTLQHSNELRHLVIADNLQLYIPYDLINIVERPNILLPRIINNLNRLHRLHQMNQMNQMNRNENQQHRMVFTIHDAFNTIDKITAVTQLKSSIVNAINNKNNNKEPKQSVDNIQLPTEFNNTNELHSILYKLLHSNKHLVEQKLNEDEEEKSSLVGQKRKRVLINGVQKLQEKVVKDTVIFNKDSETLLRWSVHFVSLQHDTFKKQYFTMFTEDNVRAYSVDNDSNEETFNNSAVSCTKGIYERIYFYISKSIQALQSYNEYKQWDFPTLYQYDTFLKTDLTNENINKYFQDWIEQQTPKKSKSNGKKESNNEQKEIIDRKRKFKEYVINRANKENYAWKNTTIDEYITMVTSIFQHPDFE